MHIWFNIAIIINIIGIFITLKAFLCILKIKRQLDKMKDDAVVS